MCAAVNLPHMRPTRLGDLSDVDDSFIVDNFGRRRCNVIGFTFDDNLIAHTRQGLHVLNFKQHILADNPNLDFHKNPLPRLIVPAFGEGGWNG